MHCCTNSDGERESESESNERKKRGWVGMAWMITMEWRERESAHSHEYSVTDTLHGASAKYQTPQKKMHWAWTMDHGPLHHCTTYTPHTPHTPHLAPHVGMFAYSLSRSLTFFLSLAQHCLCCEKKKKTVEKGKGCDARKRKSFWRERE